VEKNKLFFFAEKLDLCDYIKIDVKFLFFFIGNQSGRFSERISLFQRTLNEPLKHQESSFAKRATFQIPLAKDLMCWLNVNTNTVAIQR